MFAQILPAANIFLSDAFTQTFHMTLFFFLGLLIHLLARGSRAISAMVQQHVHVGYKGPPLAFQSRQR